MASVTFMRKADQRASSLRIPILALGLASLGFAQKTEPEKLIEGGHWKRARAIVERRLQDTPHDVLATFLLSQIRHAFGENTTPLMLAEKAVALDGRVAKYHRQLAEALGVRAQHAGPIQQLFLARRFRREMDRAIALDPRGIQALRDLLEFYLLAPGIAGGDWKKAGEVRLLAAFRQAGSFDTDDAGHVMAWRATAWSSGASAATVIHPQATPGSELRHYWRVL